MYSPFSVLALQRAITGNIFYANITLVTAQRAITRNFFYANITLVTVQRAITGNNLCEYNTCYSTACHYRKYFFASITLGTLQRALQESFFFKEFKCNKEARNGFLKQWERA